MYLRLTQVQGTVGIPRKSFFPVAWVSEIPLIRGTELLSTLDVCGDPNYDSVFYCKHQKRF